MILQKEFEKCGYEDILNNENDKDIAIDLNDLFEPDENLQELLNIYVSSFRDELFFVLDSRDENINELTDRWDKKIRVFTLVNKNSEIIKRLKYNIVQLIIYSGENLDRTKEGNLFVTRKIMIKGKILTNKSVEIENDDAIELPFYMISAKEFSPNNDETNALNKLIPNEQNLLRLLKTEYTKSSSGRTFNKDDFNRIKEWLENDNKQN